MTSNRTDLFSIDSGADNAKMIKKVVTEEFGISDWTQLVQLCIDGAGQNGRNKKGCVELVCTLFSLLNSIKPFQLRQS